MSLHNFGTGFAKQQVGQAGQNVNLFLVSLPFPKILRQYLLNDFSGAGMKEIPGVLADLLEAEGSFPLALILVQALDYELKELPCFTP